jgi:hypothetical protein
MLCRPNGTIQVNSVNIIGHVFGGDTSDMQIVSNGTVAVPEPQTWILLGVGLVSLVGIRPGRVRPARG